MAKKFVPWPSGLSSLNAVIPRGIKLECPDPSGLSSLNAAIYFGLSNLNVQIPEGLNAQIHLEYQT